MLAEDASERLFQDRVMDCARARGWLVFHPAPSQVRPGVWRTDGSGFPDLVLAHIEHGVIFAELKSAVGKLRPGQEDWQLHLGPWVEYELWRPSDWERIIARLEGRPWLGRRPWLEAKPERY